MGQVRTFLQLNKGAWLWSAAVFFFAALVPEYILPVLCLCAYCHTVRRHQVSFTNTEQAMVVYYAWTLVALTYSSAKFTFITTFFMFTFFFFGGRMMLCTVDNGEKLDALCLCGAASGGVAGLIAVVQIVLFHFGARIWKPLKTLFNPFWHFLDVGIAKLWMRILPSSMAHLMPRTQFIAIRDRASATFTNPLMLALFLCMMIPLCTYCLFYFHDRRKKIFAALCLLFSLGGIAVSYSRGPYLAVGVVFCVLLFYGKKHAAKLLSMAGVLLVAALLLFGSVFRRLLTLFDGKDISVNTRSEIWKASARMLRGHWLFGYGSGVGNVRNMLHEVYHIKQPHAHNLFLQIMLESGLIGLILFGLILFLFARNMIRLAKKGDRARGLAVTFLGSVVGFCACGMTDYVFYGMKPLCYLLMLLGLSACAVDIYSRERVVSVDETEEKVLVTKV